MKKIETAQAYLTLIISELDSLNGLSEVKDLLKKARVALNDYAENSEPERVEKIYTDGACSGNPGPGGYGLICISNGDEDHPFRTSRGYGLTTNNRMELMAAIHALELPRTSKTDIEIISDSKYVTDAVNKRWLDNWAARGFTKVANPDLWIKFHQCLCSVKRSHKVSFTWVKGHAGHKWNEMADRLAVEAIADRASHWHDNNYENQK